MEALSCYGVRTVVLRNYVDAEMARLELRRVVFDDNGSYIEDTTSGEVTELKESGGMYMLKIWVQKDSGF